MTPFLRDDELAEMTRPLVQAGARRRYLRRMGVPFIVRPDGQPLVSRSAVGNLLGLPLDSAPNEPNFSAVRKLKHGPTPKT